MRLTCRVVFLASLVIPLDAIAACHLNDWQQEVARTGYDDVLKGLANHSCLGDPKEDTDPLVERFNELTPDTGAAIPRFKGVLASVNLLADYADEHATRQVQTKSWMALSRELQDISRRLEKIKANTSESDFLDLEKAALPAKWDITRTGNIELDGESFNLLNPIACKKENNSCPAFESQRDMIRVVNLVDRLRGYSQSNNLATHYADAQLQTSRWEAYRSQGQHQYIWELWLNGRMMGEDLCPTDKTGIQRGFCRAPESQWIVLHPDAGLRWARSAHQSSELKPAFIIETLGYYQWNWDKATMTNRYGASLVAAYTNEPSGNKWSYGPMFHFGAGYNVAFTRSSGGTWGLLLNLNLADRYFGGAQKVDSYLKCLKKPNAWQLLRGQDSCN